MRISLIPVLLFSYTAFAAPNVCDPNSPLLNQLINEDGLKQELKNLGDQVAGDIGANLFFNLRRQQGGEPNCNEVVNALREAQGDPYIPGAAKDNQAVLLTGFNCEAGTFSFNVPGFIQGKHLMTNPHTMNDPVRPEQSKIINEARKGQMTTGKSLTMKVRSDLNQLRIENDGRAFRYDAKGRVTEIISYEKQSNGRYKLSCEKVGKLSFERLWQMDHTIPVIKVFAQKGVCHSKCLPQVKDLVKQNLAALSDAQRSAISANKVQRDPNDRCTRLEEKSMSEGCLQPDEFSFLTKKCSRSGTNRNANRIFSCNALDCSGMSVVYTKNGCFSNQMMSQFNQNKCSLSGGSRPFLCMGTPEGQTAEAGR